jgi:Flp pilus assembly protein TadG
MQRLRRQLHSQRGSVAVEFALIFPVFLLLVYGGLSFGLAMSCKGVLTEAAAEGARAAIGAQITPADSGSQCNAYTRVAAQQAETVLQAAGFFTPPAQVTATATVGGVPCQPGTTTTGVQVAVAISYPYGSHPTIPNAPGLGLVLPATIFVQYQVEVS